MAAVGRGRGGGGGAVRAATSWSSSSVPVVMQRQVPAVLSLICGYTRFSSSTVVGYSCYAAQTCTHSANGAAQCNNGHVGSQEHDVAPSIHAGHIPTISQFESSFWCPTYQFDLGVPFSKIGLRHRTRPCKPNLGAGTLMRYSSVASSLQVGKTNGRSRFL